MLQAADGGTLRPSGRLTPAQAQAAAVTQLDGDVQLVYTNAGDRVVPIVIGHYCGYYVLEVGD